MPTDFPVPATATHALIAELESDQSDIMTDYFASKTVQTVVIGWSTHGRDLFAEMRKAAAKFPATAHLGPGKGRYTPRVVVVGDNAHSVRGALWDGSYSPWHRDLYGDSGEAPTFTTQAEADAFVAAAGAPNDVSDNGVVMTFKWSIAHESVEHREKWSMGHGYYLGYGRYSGWQVRKVAAAGLLSRPGVTLAPHLAAYVAAAAAPAPAGPSDPVTAPTMTVNAEKGGIELRFPAKPADAVRDDLKAHGWRWSRFSSCWYQKDSPAARAFAATVVG